MSIIIVLAFYGFIIYTIVKVSNRNKRQGINQNRNTSNSYNNIPNQNVNNSRPQKVQRTQNSNSGLNVVSSASGLGGMEKETNMTTMRLSKELEDRSNDWLAQQLREEKAVLRRNDVFDFGALHQQQCAAEDLRNEHQGQHGRR